MRPLHNPAVQAFAAWLIATWLKFCFATTRWRREDQHLADAVIDTGEGFLAVFWHSRGSLSAAAWHRKITQPTKALVSLSRDGAFMAQMIGRLGFPAIRGSSSKQGEDKGGAVALREILKHLKGGVLARSPDGPRGPNRVMGPGLPVMAKLSRRPVLMVGVSIEPSIRLKTWDRYMLPLPFGRGAIVWDRVDFPADGDPDVVAKEWEARLTTVEARADALCGAERL